MSSEKNPEVVGCDASIMKNVWEIRAREYGHKMQLEEERIGKSALPSINKDWASRLVARGGNYKRVERKAKPAETQTDNNNVWKRKQPQIPPSLPRGAGSGSLSRGQSRGSSTQTPNYKDKKGQDKNLNRLKLLMLITQSQPSAMVWGKSWKYNKSLPSPAEGNTARSDWGQCWMFATQQPFSEAGKPWPNGPNTMDPKSLHLWKKSDHRMMESQELNLNLPTEWQMSWKKSEKNNKKEDVSSSGHFTLLLETQYHNENLCSSEWSESWRSTKPASQQEYFTALNDDLINESVADKKDKKREMSSRWEECWKLINHHGCNKSPSPEWASSWRAATMVLNNHKNSDGDTYEDGTQQKESYLYKGMLPSCGQRHGDLYLQLCNEFKALSEWRESWKVTKNNSKPSEEIAKVLKTMPTRMETTLGAQKVEENQKGHFSEKADPYYEQLRNNVTYRPKREFTHSQLLLLKHVENVLFSSEWKNSWKTLKHRMRMERRRMRPEPLHPFRESERERFMKPTDSQWKDSWKFTCQPLRQEPELWQEGWATTPKIRVDRAKGENHFVPRNGPTEEQSWGESWKFSRRQHQSQCGRGNVKTSQECSSVACQHSDYSWVQRKHVRSVLDWQVAWMVSESQFHHDKPSLTQWREAWKWSTFHTANWTEQVRRENWVDDVMEIQPRMEKISLQRAKAKMSRSFDNQMFRERYPEKQWSASWRTESLLNHQPSHHRSSGTTGKSTSNTTQQQHATVSDHGSKWGRSFRQANPMPHMEQPWVESSPNPCHYTFLWSRRKDIQNKINTNFSNNPAIFRLWGSSHQFLQGGNIKDKGCRLIIVKKSKARRHLPSNTEKEKQSERRWAGCHLLGKTQPRPKRGCVSVAKLKMQDETNDKFFEEWAESWRFLVRPGCLNKMPIKSLSGWTESWKFLLPPYRPMKDPKGK